MTEGSDLTGNLMRQSEKSQKYELMGKVHDVKKMIDRHLQQIHLNVTKNAEETIAYVQQLQKKNSTAVKRKPKASSSTSKSDNSLAGLMEVWKMLRVPPVNIGKSRLEVNEVWVDRLLKWPCILYSMLISCFFCEKNVYDPEFARRRRQDELEKDADEPGKEVAIDIMKYFVHTKRCSRRKYLWLRIHTYSHVLLYLYFTPNVLN